MQNELCVRVCIETGSKGFSILNDDALPLVRIDPSATEFVEGNSGSTEVKFVVVTVNLFSAALHALALPTEFLVIRK